MPKVSVVLVNYNHAAYLHERISSILVQTYNDFELLIIDNGSTDNSLEIIRKFEGCPNVKIKAFSNNVLPYQRWNDSIDIINGEYLIFICSDDSWHPQILEKLVDKFDEYPSIDLVYSQSLEIDDKGNKLRSCQYWTDELNEKRWSVDFIDSGESECKYLYAKCVIINFGGVLMRRSTFIKAGMFDTSIRYSSDWMLYAKIFANSKNFAFISEPLNYYRTNTSTFLPVESEFLEARIRVLEYLFQNVEPPDDFLERVYSPTLKWWLRIAMSGKISLKKNYQIYKVMSNMEPSLNHQIFEYILEKLKAVLSIQRFPF